MYLARIGSDGWKPESITAYQNDYPPVTFNFNYFIPQHENSVRVRGRSTVSTFSQFQSMENSSAVIP
ncbi:embryo-specific 3, partial [Trifolium medium]|nr:embryo-specific 3 [Trifolium medium]